MNTTDPLAAWQRQSAALPLPSADTLARLRNDFEAQRRREARALLIRDCVEAGTGFAVAVGLVVLWIFLHLPAEPMGGAVVLVLGVSALFVRERLLARRARLGADAPVLAKVEADLAELRHQRRLLLSMSVWYLGPLMAALSLVLVAMWMFLRTKLPAADLGTIPTLAAVYAGLMVAVWFVNREAVRRRIDPRLAELEALRAALRAEA